MAGNEGGVMASAFFLFAIVEISSALWIVLFWCSRKHLISLPCEVTALQPYGRFTQRKQKPANRMDSICLMSARAQKRFLYVQNIIEQKAAC